jgi:hypothetical protein
MCVAWLTLLSFITCSFAHVAVNAPEAYVKPTVLENGSFYCPRTRSLRRLTFI